MKKHNIQIKEISIHKTVEPIQNINENDDIENII